MKLELGKQYPPPEENVHTDSLIRRLREKMDRFYGSGQTLRDAPQRFTASSREFVVEPGLSDELRVGAFKETRTFKVAALTQRRRLFVNYSGKSLGRPGWRTSVPTKCVLSPRR